MEKSRANELMIEAIKRKKYKTKDGLDSLYRDCDQLIHQAICISLISPFYKKLNDTIRKQRNTFHEIIYLFKGEDINWFTLSLKGGNKIYDLFESMDKLELDDLVDIGKDISYSKGKTKSPPKRYNDLLESPKCKKMLKLKLSSAYIKIKENFHIKFGSQHRKELEKYLEQVDKFSSFVFKYFGCKNGFPSLDSFERTINKSKTSENKVQKRSNRS